MRGNVNILLSVVTLYRTGVFNIFISAFEVFNSNVMIVNNFFTLFNCLSKGGDLFPLCLCGVLGYRLLGYD